MLNNEITSKSTTDCMDFRFRAYIEFLKTALGTDENGLADLVGIDRREWSKLRNMPVGEWGTSKVFALVMVTRIDADWLFCMNE